MKKILLIDISNNREIKVGLRIDTKEYIIKEKIGRQKAQVVLPLIDKLLRKKGLEITDINGIEIYSINGSFTGIRVGMSIANALSFALKIPVKTI
ncbi:MAG: hypothetical protein AAB600_01275 [Patescibacteria group bacterium]